MAREAPQLLPLVVMALREGLIPAEDDLVAALRRLCLRSGLGPATWRHLLRHGVRWLRPVWHATPEPHRTDASIDVLQAFAAAGHPRPPTARLLHSWMFAAHEPELGGAFTGVPPAVLAALCYTDRTAAVDDQDIVLDWARAARPPLDKRQRRAGWPWLVARARAWERDERLPPPPGSETAASGWPTPLEHFASGGFEAQALGDPEALASAALAFRNCLVDMVWPCQGGTVHVFVVHTVGGGRAAAVAGISSDPQTGAWQLMDIRGRFNQAVSEGLQDFAQALVEAFRAVCPPSPMRAAVPPAQGGRVYRLIDDEAPYWVCRLPE